MQPMFQNDFLLYRLLGKYKLSELAAKVKIAGGP